MVSQKPFLQAHVFSREPHQTIKKFAALCHKYISLIELLLLSKHCLLLLNNANLTKHILKNLWSFNKGSNLNSFEFCIQEQSTDRLIHPPIEHHWQVQISGLRKFLAPCWKRMNNVSKIVENFAGTIVTCTIVYELSMRSLVAKTDFFDKLG